MFFVWIVFLLLTTAAQAQEQPACPGGDSAVTVPAPVDLAKLNKVISELKLADQKPAIQMSDALKKDIANTFSPEKTKTKMEQFYRLLYVFAQYVEKPNGTHLEFDPATVRAVLLESKVFTDLSIPSHIKRVDVEIPTRARPKYRIEFDQPQTRLQLNSGEGFYLFRNGKCQHAKELIFNDTFSALLSVSSKGNLMAHDFLGVDLFGDFGNRGIVDIDIQYVELKSVEFYKGTNLGKVTAYVSQEEFKKNNHNPILKWITRIVPDRDVQPIDW